MTLSCTDAMVPGATLTEKAALLRKWGYKGIAVFADYDSWDEEKMEELLSLEEHTGVKPCEFLFMSPAGGKLMSENPEESEATRRIYTKAAKVCAKIGAVTEIEYLLAPQDPLPLFDIYRQMDPTQEARFLDLYRAIAQPVLGTQAAVLLEGINRYESPYMNRIVDCKRIADKTGIEETGVLPDFFHMSIEERSIEESIAALGNSIKHVHMGDNNRCLPGKGNINWESGLKALKAQGYDRFLNLECSTLGNPQAALPEAADYLNRILERI